MTNNETARLYGVSIGNGNDGVSQMFPRMIVRTSDPYQLAEYVLADQYVARFARKVMRDCVVDGEAEYTVSATAYDPPGRHGAGWCDANGAHRIVEVFPITLDDATANRSERDRLQAYGYHGKVIEGVRAAISRSLENILKRAGKPIAD